MANRFWSRERYTPDKNLVDINAVVAIGATGAPTLQQWVPATGGGGAYAAAVTGGFRGVKSVVRNGTGDYTFTMQDSYQRLVNIDLIFQAAGTNKAAAPTFSVTTTGTTTGTSTGGTVRLICQSATNTAADPASGEIMLVSFTFQNSSAQ